MSVSGFDERVPLAIGVQFLAADGTTWKTITTGALTGSRIDDILASNSGAGAHVVELRLQVGGINYVCGSVSIPAGSGFGGVAAVPLSTAPVPANQGGWTLGYNVLLQAHVTVAMGAAEELDLAAFGGAL